MTKSNSHVPEYHRRDSVESDYFHRHRRNLLLQMYLGKLFDLRKRIIDSFSTKLQSNVPHDSTQALYLVCNCWNCSFVAPSAETAHRNNSNKRVTVSKIGLVEDISYSNKVHIRLIHIFDNDAANIVRKIIINDTNFKSAMSNNEGRPLTRRFNTVNCDFLQCIQVTASASGTHTAACSATAFLPPRKQTDG